MIITWINGVIDVFFVAVAVAVAVSMHNRFESLLAKFSPS